MPTYTLNLGQVGQLGKGWAQSPIDPQTGQPATERPFVLDASGAQVVMDFYLKSVLDGHGYQIRAGTVTTPLTGTTAITDTSAEYCIDPQPGYTAIPVCQIISIRAGVGTIHEFATKSVATASTSGTAFVPLPLFGGGQRGTTTARVAATAGTVTVTLELATTTRRHWSFAQAIAMGAYDAKCYWEPRMPPAIRSISGAPRCLYTQIAAATTGDDYYANLDFLEFINNQIGL